MTTLPPLPDHRMEALRALDSLGANAGWHGATIGSVADTARIAMGDAWLAINQLARIGLVTTHEGDSEIHERHARGLYWLTDEGRNVLVSASAQSGEGEPQ